MFETGTATGIADLLTKLGTFATTVAGTWVQDQLDTGGGSFALHKTGAFGNIYVSFRWDTATPQHLSVHQALGYTGGNQPGNHPNDSGNGYNATSSHVDTNLALERHVSDLGVGPFPSYHFFEDDHYIHVVVEVATDHFRHFGFGLLNPKIGDWAGGEYAYGNRMSTGTNHNAISASDYALLDGIADEADNMATLHVEGLEGEAGASKWMVVFGNAATSTETDTAGNARERGQGGFRGGPAAIEMGNFNGDALAGNVPMYSIGVWHKDNTLQRVYFLGDMPDVRAINIKHFQPKEEVVIGGVTWVVFPFALKTLDNVAGRTYHSGIAYKKVTT